jgi:hypothetical protein
LRDTYMAEELDNSIQQNVAAPHLSQKASLVA